MNPSKLLDYKSLTKSSGHAKMSFELLFRTWGIINNSRSPFAENKGGARYAVNIITTQAALLDCHTHKNRDGVIRNLAGNIYCNLRDCSMFACCLDAACNMHVHEEKTVPVFQESKEKAKKRG